MNSKADATRSPAMTPTPATQALLPVTPEARKAACEYLSDIAGLRGGDAVTDIRDDHPTLIAFARFERDITARQAHSLPGALTEACKRFVSDFEMDFCIEGVIVDDPDRLMKQHYLLIRAALTPSALSEKVVKPGFQAEVGDWMLECFGPEIAADRLERGDRWTEEALELAQTIPGFTAERAHALVDYVFARPVGERGQEVGGSMVTLAALCNSFSLNIAEEAERELARVWTKVEAIRAKQAAKPTGSALPIAVPSALSGDAGEGIDRVTSSISFGNLRDLVGMQRELRPGTFAYAALIDLLDSLPSHQGAGE